MKAFRLNEYEWWSGRDAEEAIAVAMTTTGCTREETVDEMFFGEEPLDLPVNRDEDGLGPTTIGEILAGMDGPGFICGSE